MYFFGSNTFGKQQKKQVVQALDAGDTDRLLAILSTYEPNADAYNLIDQLEFHTLLTYACCRGHLGIVKMLVETFHVDADKRDRRDRMTPLMYAALYNEPNLDIVRYLREECSVDVELVNQEGFTAAQLAEQNENSKIFEYLSNPVEESEESKQATLPATELPDASERDQDRQARNDDGQNEDAEEQKIRVASLESALSEANKRCSRLIKENVAADETYKAIQDHVHQLESENKKLRQRVRQEDERRERMQRQWEAALTESQDEISRLRRKLVSSSSNDTSVEKLKEESAQMRRNVASAHDQITLLKQQLEQRVAESDRAEKSYENEMRALREEFAAKIQAMEQREQERQRVKEDKKESDGEDDFVVIEPPEESSRY